jgi:hypothetical protein
MTGFYILIGVGMLFMGLVALVKVGLWFWLMSQVFHRPDYTERYEERRERGRERKTAEGLKTWLGIVATTLGIVTTTVGLVKECGPEKAAVEEEGGRLILPSEDYEGDGDHVVPAYSNVCCSQIGNCVLMMGSLPVGESCSCFDLFGNVAPGRVCR